jgi:hypothetical protein
LLWTAASFAQEAAQPPAQQQPAQQPAQTPPPQSPAQQTPAQPTPAQQTPAQQPAPAKTETPQEPDTQTRNTRLPPAPPKVVDVRMPGEAGWFIGVTGWVPVGNAYVDKGKAADFTGTSFFQFPGTSKGQPGGEIGIAAGLHNSLRISYMFSKVAGTTTAPNDLVLFSQAYNKGDQLSTSYKFSDYKISYEYLTWPYPVEGRHFRLKTLWQVQYIVMKTAYDAPVRSNTPDSAGNLISYETVGSKSYFSPTFGLGIHEYATRHFRFEANASGFAIPKSFNIWDADASIAYRVGKIELRGGVRALHFHSSAKSDYYFRGTLSGAVVGVRWYSD